MITSSISDYKERRKYMFQFKKYDLEKIFGIKYSSMYCLGKKYSFLSFGFWFFGFELEWSKK